MLLLRPMQGVEPQDVSLEQAVELLAARAARMQAKAAKAGVSGTEPGGARASQKSGRAQSAATSKDAYNVSNDNNPAKRDGTRPRKRAKSSKSKKAQPRAAGADDAVQTAVVEGAASGAARKRGLNPYMQWKQQRWPSLKAEHPGMSFKELMGLTSQEWANLDPAVKQHFGQNASDQRTQATPQTVST